MNPELHSTTTCKKTFYMGIHSRDKIFSEMLTVQGRNLCGRNTSKADKIETHFYSTNTEQLGATAGVKSGGWCQIWEHSSNPYKDFSRTFCSRLTMIQGSELNIGCWVVSPFIDSLGEDNAEEETRFSVFTDFFSKLPSLTVSHSVCCHTCRIE